MACLIPPESVRRLSGFGGAQSADGFLFQPIDAKGIESVFKLARCSRRKVVLRGAGRSYGDPAIGPECLIVDLTNMNRILTWDPGTGVIEAEPGATLFDIWQRTLPDSWWLPVVSGTSRTSLGGALAMNIHGKNNWARGTLGEHVLELEVLLPTGETRVLPPDDELFFAVVGGLGLLGVIVRAKLQMKRVTSGEVRVEAASCRNWQDIFQAFVRFESDAEYVVGWVDCFAKGAGAGRGIIHAAWHQDEGPDAKSLELSHQELPSKIMGLVPKSSVWRILKVLNRRPLMKLLNAAKQAAGHVMEHGKTKSQSLAEYNFLLDYVPGWERAYLPGGLIQCQFFVSKESALDAFKEIVAMQQAAKLESFLGVIKRHRKDAFLLSHAVDGFSLALDFKVTESNRERLWELAGRMSDLALSKGGRFYFAKDSTLTAAQAHSFLGDALTRFRKFKSLCDPDGLLTSSLAERLQLVENTGIGRA